MTADEWLAANPTATLREAFEAGGLSPTARRVRHLRRQGLTPKAISQVLKVEVSSVQRHLTRAGMTSPTVSNAAQRLRDHLAEHGPQTRQQVAEALGGSASVLGCVAGVYVHSWIETPRGFAAVYAVGPGPSAPRPLKRPPRTPTAGLTLQNAWVYTAQG